MTILLSWVIWPPGVLVTFGILALQIDDSIYVLLNVIGGSIPTLVGLSLYYRDGGMPKFKEVLKRSVDPRLIKKLWWLPLLFLMPLINGSAMVLGILTGGAAPNLPFIQQWYLIPVLFIVGFIPISNAFREEIGWRGFAIERLQSRQNALMTSIIIGFVWGIWHLPLYFFPIAMDIYGSKPFWLFITNTITLSIIMTWLYNNNNKSIFTGVTFHVALNITPAIFPFEQAGLGMYFNMVLLLIVAFFIVLYYGYQTLMKEPEQKTAG